MPITRSGGVIVSKTPWRKRVTFRLFRRNAAVHGGDSVPSMSPHHVRSRSPSEAWRARGWTTVSDWSDWESGRRAWWGRGPHCGGVLGHSWRSCSLWSDRGELVKQFYETLAGAAHLAHLLAGRAQHTAECDNGRRVSQPDASALSTNIKELRL